MKRRKKRLRIDRILYCLAILILIISLIKLGITSLINYNIYKDVKNDNIMKINSSELKVWTKTINYINEKVDQITIKHKSNYVTVVGNSVKNHINLDINTYNTKIDEDDFNKQKGLYLKSTPLIEKAISVKLKMPYYLRKNEEVDVYGVKNNKYTLYKNKVKIKDKYISFDLNDEYDDYFITYIGLDSINTKTVLKVTVGDEIRPSLIFVPSNATNKSISYSESKKLLTIKGSTITATKKGETVLTIKNKKNNISTDIKITIDEKKEEVKKEEKKEEKTYEVENKDGIYYVDGVMIVNKTYPLPSTYNPGGLLDEFMNAFYEMQTAAELDGVELWIQSGFRDYETQEIIYNNYVNSDGKEEADTYSARPGYSEHQSGLAADINSPYDSFNDTYEAKWLGENAYKYGFIIRFPEGKESSTGYKYESWHIRYLGKDLAKDITLSGKSLEEYFGITSVYSN